MNKLEGDGMVPAYMDLRNGYELRSKFTEISTGLKLFEKISVIFLLSDKSKAGLEIMDTLLTLSEPRFQHNKFYKWFIKQPLFANKNWKDNLGEVLSIVQNYRLAKSLGFSKKDLEQKFSNNISKEHSICSVKRVLYELCEELNKDQLSQLIALVENKTNDVPVHKFTYLEYKLLHWSSEGLINLDKNIEVNVNILLKSLESLGFKNLAHEIEVTVEKNNHQLVKKKSLKTEQSVFEYYPVNDDNTGLCIIISEKNFSHCKFPKRWGTEKDVHRLIEIFTAFGFDIRIHIDLTSEQFMNTLSYYTETIKENASFFVLIILSHGSENIIYTSDSQPIQIDTIETMFQAECCPKLIGKPKIFIVQACQGEKWQQVFVKNDDCSEVETDNFIQPSKKQSVSVGPQKGDSLIAWSTVQGYASFRDKYNGSWYVQELCNELWKFGDAFDLVEIFTRVNSNLRNKVYNGQFMVPSLQLSLRAKVQFPVVQHNVLKGKKLMLERLLFEKYFRDFLLNYGSLESLMKLG